MLCVDRAPVERLKQQIDEYFAMCDGRNGEPDADTRNVKGLLRKPYTISGLCLYLGKSRGQLDRLEHEPETEALVRRAKYRIESYIEENMLNGLLQAAPGAVSLKHNFGWGERAEAGCDEYELADREMGE